MLTCYLFMVTRPLACNACLEEPGYVLHLDPVFAGILLEEGGIESNATSNLVLCSRSVAKTELFILT